MAVSAKMFMIAGAALCLCGAARAQQAQPAPAQADHCEGTLCDLYYGSRGNTPAQATAAVPSTAPGVPAGATPMTVPSGGILNWFSRGSSGSTTASGAPAAQPARLPTPPSAEATATNSYMHLGTGGLLGDHQDRCTGTLCDVYYGASPAETKSAGQQTAAAAEPHVVHRHIVHESETRPKCSPAADPWHCYR